MTTLKVRNPRTGEADFELGAPLPDELAAICSALRESQPAWAARPLAERIGVLRRWADAIEADADAITAALCADTGRWRMSVEDPRNVVATIRGWCDRAGDVLTVHSGRSSLAAGIEFSTWLDPYPLLAVISPWNVPFMLAMVDAIPALLAGCAAIIKPSEITPRFIEPVMDTVRAVPELEKVLRLVAGGAEVGQQILQEADIVVFTGSVPTGRKIAEAAARRFIPVFLELGGKDPVIVTECADLTRAAAAIARGALLGAGQLCYSVERVYAQRAVCDRLVEALKEEVLDLDINYPDIRHGHIGPLIFERQADIIQRHLDDAVSRGAVIRAGGAIETHGGGLWLRPTIVTGVTHDMLLMTEETFGPVIPVMAYDTVDEAVELANDSEYGLSAAVMAGSKEKAESIGRRLNAGAISLMDTTLNLTIMRDAEKNAFGYSGLGGGSRTGPAAFMRFVRKKTLIANTGTVRSLRELGEG